MKRSSAELKAMARESLEGRYTLAVELVIAYFAINFFLYSINLRFFSDFLSFNLISLLGNFLIFLLSMMISAGLSYCFLAMTRGWVIRISDLFYAFRYQADKALILSLIYSVIFLLLEFPLSSILSLQLSEALSSHVFLALLLVFASIACFIVAVICMLALSMCYYLYIDHPEMNIRQLLAASFQIMKGNKIRLFYIYISFFGLLLLSVLTCFIGILWVIPYISCTTAMFYRELNGELPPKMDTVEF